MPFIQDRKKEPLNKGFSSVIFKWCSCDMLTQLKAIKKGLDFLKPNPASQVNYINYYSNQYPYSKLEEET